MCDSGQKVQKNVEIYLTLERHDQCSAEVELVIYLNSRCLD